MRLVLVMPGSATLSYQGVGSVITSDGAYTYSYAISGRPLAVRNGGTAAIAETDLHADLTATFNPASGALTGSRR